MTALFDLAYLQEYTDGDEDMIAVLVETFYETFDEGLVELSQEITDGDNQKWSDISHKLKGAAAFLGAEELRNLAMTGQEMKTASLAQRQDLFNQISQNYEDVKSALKSQLG